MSKVLVVGGSGFVGSYVLQQLKADNLDLREGQDVLHGIHKKYKTIVFLPCDQRNLPEAYDYNWRMYKVLDEYRKKYPKTHLIYVSSAAIYYKAAIYGQTKRLGEVYAKRFKNHTILRPSNIYGHGDGHGAPDLFQKGEKVIFGDGNQIRDLIPVETVADTIVDFVKKPRVGVFNVSSGKGTTINEMFLMFGVGKSKHVKDIAHNMGVSESILEPGEVFDD